MAPSILLVDDERNILRLLHSALDTLAEPDLQVLEASSGEDAFDILQGSHVDLLVTEFSLPAMNGIQTAARAREVQPDIKVIHLTASKDRELRRRMLAAGAVAVFDKPVPLGDFVDAVQRGLGLARTILQTEDDASITPAVLSLTDRIAGLQGDLGVDALFVISSRGRVAARAGSLNDSSMEVSLISSAAATIAAGMKVAQANHGSGGSHFSIFPAGDQDIILVPLGPSHALLAAGEGLAAASSLAATLRALERAGGELASSLESGSAEPAAVNRSSASRTPGQVNAELDDLLTDPSRANLSPEDLDAYWNEGAARHGDGSPSEGGISYDEARKRGLTPGQES